MSPLPNCSVSLLPPAWAEVVVVVRAAVAAAGGEEGGRRGRAAGQRHELAARDGVLDRTGDRALRRGICSLAFRCSQACRRLLAGVCASTGPLREPRRRPDHNRRIPIRRSHGWHRRPLDPTRADPRMGWHGNPPIPEGTCHPSPGRCRLPPPGCRRRPAGWLRQRSGTDQTSSGLERRQRRQGGDDQGLHLQAGQHHRARRGPRSTSPTRTRPRTRRPRKSPASSKAAAIDTGKSGKVTLEEDRHLRLLLRSSTPS